MRLSLSGKPLKYLLTDKTGAFKRKSELENPVSATTSLTASYFKDLSVKISADMNKWDNEVSIFRRATVLDGSAFSSHTTHVMESCVGKKVCSVQDRPLDVNITVSYSPMKMSRH